MEWYKKYAKYHNYEINPKTEKVVAEFLAYEKNVHGQYYCPQKPRLPENICPCEDLCRNNVCQCSFFIRKGEIIE